MNTNNLSERAFIASQIEAFDVDYELAKILMESEPPNDRLENLKWWFSAEAKIKVMKADALLLALKT